MGRRQTGWYFRVENGGRAKFNAYNQTFKAYTRKTKLEYPGMISEKLNP